MASVVSGAPPPTLRADAELIRPTVVPIVASHPHYNANQHSHPPPHLDQSTPSGGHATPATRGPQRRTGGDNSPERNAFKTLPTNIQKQGQASSAKGGASKAVATNAKSHSLPGHSTSLRGSSEGTARPNARDATHPHRSSEGTNTNHRDISHRISGSSQAQVPSQSSTSSQRGNGVTSRSSGGVMNVRVDVNQNPARERRQAPTVNNTSRQLQPQNPGPAQASSSNNPSVSGNIPRKSSSATQKDPKERYVKHVQLRQSTTMPNTSNQMQNSRNNRNSSGDVSQNNRPRPRSLTSLPPTSSTRTPGSSSRGHTQVPSQTNHKNSLSKAVGQQQRQQQLQQRDRSQDIARITVDARSVISRTTHNGPVNTPRPHTATASLPLTLHSNSSESRSNPSRNNGTSQTQSSVNLSSSVNNSIAHSRTERNSYAGRNTSQTIDYRSAPSTNNAISISRQSRIAQNIANLTERISQAASQDSSSSSRNAHHNRHIRTVDPSSLHLDIVNVPQDQSANNGNTTTTNQNNTQIIQTSELSPGVSSPDHRQERPEVNEALPDLLNSHVLPPYTVRQNQHRQARASNNNNSRTRSNHTNIGGRSRRSQRHSLTELTQIDDEEKGCCSHESCMWCLTTLTTFRWVLVSLALLGVLCVVTGVILGALHMTVGSSYLTLSLMFVGLGVMLEIVVGVGWKCTPAGHEPCHLLFNLGEHYSRDTAATSSSRRRNRERANQWYGGASYPEFRYRRPPPSYSASMQEYQQQLMVAQSQLNTSNAAVDLPPSYVSDDDYSLPSSPPPSYKSRASTTRPALHITFPPQGEEHPTSRPPTYSSRAGTGIRPPINTQGLSSGGIDNPACSDTDLPLTSSSTSASYSSNSSRRQSDAGVSSAIPTSDVRSSENAPGSSTLHRIGEVVGYLDNVLDVHDRTLDYENINDNTIDNSNSAPIMAQAESIDTSRSIHAVTKRASSESDGRSSLNDDVRIRDTPL